MAEPDDRLVTPVQLGDDAESQVKIRVDAAIVQHGHAMERYAAVYLAHRVGELTDEPDPATVGCDTGSATLVRAMVEQALNDAVRGPATA